MPNMLALAMFQDDLTARDTHLIMIAVGVLAVVSLIQALAFLVGGLKMLGVVAEMKALAHDLHGKTAPILAKTQEIVTDLKPKVQAISANALQMSYTVRVKTEEVGETISNINRTVNEVNMTISEANSKTRAQVGHVDRMVTTALDSTEKLTTTVVSGINVPVRKVAGVIAGLKTGFETLAKNFQGQAAAKSTKYPDKFDY